VHWPFSPTTLWPELWNWHPKPLLKKSNLCQVELKCLLTKVIMREGWKIIQIQIQVALCHNFLAHQRKVTLLLLMNSSNWSQLSTDGKTGSGGGKDDCAHLLQAWFPREEMAGEGVNRCRQIDYLHQYCCWNGVGDGTSLAHTMSTQSQQVFVLFSRGSLCVGRPKIEQCWVVRWW